MGHASIFMEFFVLPHCSNYRPDHPAREGAVTLYPQTPAGKLMVLRMTNLHSVYVGCHTGCR